MVPPAGLVSLVATNLRWAHAQNGGEQARESRTRTRGRALVAPQGRALRGPRIRVVAEWPRPSRRNDGGRRGQGEQRTHPGSRRHVDVHQPVDAREKSTVNDRRWKTHGIKRIDVRECRGSGGGRRVQREIRTF